MKKVNLEYEVRKYYERFGEYPKLDEIIALSNSGFDNLNRIALAGMKRNSIHKMTRKEARDMARRLK